MNSEIMLSKVEEPTLATIEWKYLGMQSLYPKDWRFATLPHIDPTYVYSPSCLSGLVLIVSDPFMFCVLPSELRMSACKPLHPWSWIRLIAS